MQKLDKNMRKKRAEIEFCSAPTVIRPEIVIDFGHLFTRKVATDDFDMFMRK